MFQVSANFPPVVAVPPWNVWMARRCSVEKRATPPHFANIWTEQHTVLLPERFKRKSHLWLDQQQVQGLAPRHNLLCVRQLRLQQWWTGGASCR